VARRYAVLDVFAAVPLEGNPLAVVLDAEGLTDQAMQSIAGEFNLAETVFVLPADNPVHAARLRIFTPRRELPFAGHPTVGTAVLLALEKVNEPDASSERDLLIILEERIGPVRCGVSLERNRGHARFTAPRLPAADQEPGPVDALAAALGLTTQEIGFENHVPSAFNAGVPFIFVPIRNLAAIAKAAPQAGSWARAFGERAAYLYTRETEVVARQFHARMFGAPLGVAEDPATGSAAVALAGVIQKFDAHPSGTHHITIEQGFEMGRPSIIQLEIEVGAGSLEAVRVAGEAVLVARGTLDV
jgi:trans-2,3-dihydro-3-hydroxyanthranilate isomerase